MKFSELTKEQKQLLILALGGGVTLLMLVSNLVLKPAKAAAETAAEVIDEFGKEVTLGELVLQRDKRVRTQVQADAEALLHIYEKQLPPDTNRYGWALDNLISLSDKVGLEIFVREARGVRYIPERLGEKSNPDSVPMWVPYAVEVELRSNFANLKKFLKSIRNEFPYSSVANMEITSSEQDPENHFVTFTVEWPVFRYEEDLVWIREQANGNQK